jgi:hypothetical protein
MRLDYSNYYVDREEMSMMSLYDSSFQNSYFLLESD